MTNREERWRKALISENATLAQAIKNLNEGGLKLALCVHENGQLYGSISDGDIRRGLIQGLTLQDSIKSIINASPLVVPEGAKPETVRGLMVANKIQQIPVIDANGWPVGLHLWDEIDTDPVRDNIVIIMAGGKGTRLRPFTEDRPKPMLEIAGKPMMQHIIERAQKQGFSRFIISLNYLGDVIRDHFGDGSDFGIYIDYVNENEPLGTAGALSLLVSRPDKPFIVTNGDVLADINYGELIDFRDRHDASAVMAVRVYEWANPFGVVQMDGPEITGFAEKPISRSYINAGIYAFDPGALDLLEMGQHCDMPSLFDRLRENGQRTVAYPMHEPWLDVGRPDDLKRANEIFQQRDES